MTESEQALWKRLRGKQVRGVQFYRQTPIGPYIVDFYAPAAKLVVEVDGSQHQETAGYEHDAQRDSYLQRVGLHVLRFDGRQVLLDIKGVMTAIDETVVASFRKENPPTPPFFKGGIYLRIYDSSKR